MKIEQLQERSAGACELCGASAPLKVYEVLPGVASGQDPEILVCEGCLAQLEKKAEPDSAHWRVLTTSMWSEVPAVQVASWRMLQRLKAESWASEALDMMYLDEDNLAWAKAAGDEDADTSVELHKDANGAVLQSGDSVVLTKSLDVKGSTLNAKMGTVVKNIRLVEGNTEQIEGKIEGQVIVILTKYVRKQGGA